MSAFFSSNWTTDVFHFDDAAAGVLNTPGPWRPPKWSNGVQKWSVSTTLPGQQQSQAGGAASTNQNGTPVQYFFDAVMHSFHSETAVATRHPVQKGASITDHVYANPVTVVLDVKFSDAQQGFKTQQYTGNKSRSVAAYQAFQQIKNLRLPCTVTTKLSTYLNMVLVDISADDSARTVYGGHFVLRFEQIIMGSVSTTTVSARPNQSDSVYEGTQNGDAVPQSLQQLSGAGDTNFVQPQWNSNTKPNLAP